MVWADTETTGLDPRRDRLRLLQLACQNIDSNPLVYVVDCLRVSPVPLFEALADKLLVFHNAAFDLSFLAALGFEPAQPVRCTMILSRLLYWLRLRDRPY